MENGSNHIAIIGRVCAEPSFNHEVYGEGFYKFSIEIERLSDTTDVLPVTVSERILDRDKVVMGELVSVEGQIRSYNSYVEADRRNRLVLTVFAEKVSTIADYDSTNPNVVFLDGFICKPPVRRTTPFGREISDVLLAVNRSYNKSDYVPCIAWGRNAYYSSTLAVGDKVRLCGRMQSRPYQKHCENGETLERVAYEISVSKIEKDAGANNKATGDALPS